MGLAGYKGGPIEVAIDPDTLPLPVDITNFETITFKDFGENLDVSTSIRESVHSVTATAGVFEKCAFISISG
ncbi:MAG: hypothetical protein GWN00_32760, partial [Aliifodinibius sp.]|nr:hypothetical protein [Fodinibius sp.]NIU08454.1 hypothetical protein [Phycisphaerae bacterium]NIV15540.1 hypothetical protein [Fodinibius sp.]NIY29389.1 hypothetical protein [Fodinibius sp.]